ncbi:MAG: arsenate reductase (glutaredoxin) [Zetaproteobacteria bacterium CG12_big_fil_rev_8_21_14_0_65_55_1124]|nr:MAG: arsenate reductase (glutaredoxin) [Zetaproteobacteria bacterium CG1_02_55_237]PIS19841.1 MAG: arsenate reductase (glutaredoxin) [Zetaproteobacteria bacterium CG08_land_8_20_14_0_20_55_17]PIW42870.1 MAG: arsenate reductase (glutaredoxin) [Zetaproteobacteria bacterium CG12_big_fil_rev_8_21_14_0_65_55_1124]PIY51688.1 MAG: arsenate reductase (glutaredoxin) [Zetaproteobacteria bacterium CG_4_10_14_0_8_um_filter_55_43]PIZ39861.1 MAG: arsenate reductase (glutaredoxin) [Zetaproteobacteria bacte
MSVTIYHNPRCSKSRATLALLSERGIEAEIIEYLQSPPSAEELDHILVMLGKLPEELMRSGEDEYKAYIAGKDLSRAEAIALMVAHPKLIERPIVVNGDKAAVGRPPEAVLDIL